MLHGTYVTRNFRKLKSRACAAAERFLGVPPMLRRELLTIVPCIVALAIAIPALAGSPGDSWPTFRGAATHRRLARYGAADRMARRWAQSSSGKRPARARLFEPGDRRRADLHARRCPVDGRGPGRISDLLRSGRRQAVWKTKTGAPWTEGKPTWQSSRSTPTVDGDRVYVLTPHGVLVCCQTDGHELWRKDLVKDFEGKKADSWGYSESVLIDGDKFVCTPGGPTNTMVGARQNNRPDPLDDIPARGPRRRPCLDRGRHRRRHAQSMCRPPAAARWASGPKMANCSGRSTSNRPRP